MPKRVPKKRVPKNIPPKQESVPPELDFTSESFDPKRALSLDSIYLPFPKAKTYNNIAEYYSHTFLKSEDRSKSVKEETRERNFAWYYSTLGYDPSYGNEYYTQLYREQVKIKRRKGKKPASTSTTVCDNMRSNKIVKLKSKHKLYCQRKFKNWRKQIASKQGNIASLSESSSVASISGPSTVASTSEPSHVASTSGPSSVASTSGPSNVASTSDVWISTKCAKEFVNPSAVSVCSDLKNPTSALGRFLANLMKSSELKTTTLQSVDRSNALQLHSRNRNVILKCNDYTDELSFLKCILFGKVDLSDVEGDPNLNGPYGADVSFEPEYQNMQLMSSQDSPVDVDSSNQFCIVPNNDNECENLTFSETDAYFANPLKINTDSLPENENTSTSNVPMNVDSNNLLCIDHRMDNMAYSEINTNIITMENSVYEPKTHDLQSVSGHVPPSNIESSNILNIEPNNILNIGSSNILNIGSSNILNIEPSNILNIGSSNILNIELNAANVSDNSAYETESSGYMSDCSEAERVTKHSKGPAASKHRHLNLIQKTMKSKRTKHANAQSGINSLQTSGSIASKTISREDLDVNFSSRIDSAGEPSNIVETDQESLNTVSRGAKNLKSPNGCACNASKELNDECVCGFYKKALSEVRKFKIPRKKCVQDQDGSDKKKRKRL